MVRPRESLLKKLAIRTNSPVSSSDDEFPLNDRWRRSDPDATPTLASNAFTRRDLTATVTPGSSAAAALSNEAGNSMDYQASASDRPTRLQYSPDQVAMLEAFDTVVERERSTNANEGPDFRSAADGVLNKSISEKFLKDVSLFILFFQDTYSTISRFLIFLLSRPESIHFDNLYNY
jgi:hypothetical protein